MWLQVFQEELTKGLKVREGWVVWLAGWLGFGLAGCCCVGLSLCPAAPTCSSRRSPPVLQDINNKVK